MLKLEDADALTGIDSGQVVRVVPTEPVGDSALTVYYKPIVLVSDKPSNAIGIL